ncbi:hypothetical protein LENED_012093 [Lentinula edodes]|uniref:Uncharacterized protein n=1 Tax=Lentinula edodes TaxID=5353 RepID=A0A1Q3ERP9_LENED|nr:hypothetical protein LENED_012093 [Lentinula edodes]
MSKSKRERLEFEKATTRKRRVSRFLDVSAQEVDYSEDEDEYEDEEYHNDEDHGDENLIEKQGWPAEWVSHYQGVVHGADTPLRAVTPVDDERGSYLHTSALSPVFDGVETPLRAETPLSAITPLHAITPPLHAITSLVDNTTAPKITTEESTESLRQSHTPERMTEQGPRFKSTFSSNRHAYTIIVSLINSSRGNG